MGLFHWFQFLDSPWQQESGRLVESQPLWPVLIVLGLPAIVCVYLYRYGKDDARHIKLTDYQPGVFARRDYFESVGRRRQQSITTPYRTAIS